MYYDIFAPLASILPAGNPLYVSVALFRAFDLALLPYSIIPGHIFTLDSLMYSYFLLYYDIFALPTSILPDEHPLYAADVMLIRGCPRRGVSAAVPEEHDPGRRLHGQAL